MQNSSCLEDVRAVVNFLSSRSFPREVMSSVTCRIFSAHISLEYTTL